MNRTSSGFLTLEKAIPGFLQYKQAEGLSPRTLTGYQHDLLRWLSFQGNTRVGRVTSMDLVSYMSWLSREYRPQRFNGNKEPLSGKTLRNHWITLSAFFRWFSEEFDIANPMRRVPSPKYKTKQIEPLTKDEVHSLLKVSEFSRTARTNNRRSYVMRKPTARRDRAIVLTLLDTGVRAGEFCALRICNLDQSTGKLEVSHGQKGAAKGGQGRTVYLGKIARRAVWRYLVEREDTEWEDAPLFVGKFGRLMNPNSLRQMIKSLADRASVKNCHPHRFRHTFAITYLRSGGDVFTLQALLGHSSLDMVRHYARVAEIDIQAAHRRASPADNWRL